MTENIVKQKKEIPFHFAYLIAYKIKQNDGETAPQGHRFSAHTTPKMVSLILFDEITLSSYSKEIEGKYCNICFYNPKYSFNFTIE